MGDLSMKPWVNLIGISENCPNDLSKASLKLIESADVIFGAPRHLQLASIAEKSREWPVPFSLAPLLACRGRKVVVLASGDPFWFGVGGSLAQHLSPDEWTCTPAPSCFSFAAARMGWRLEETACFGLHNRPLDSLYAALGGGRNLLCLLYGPSHIEEFKTYVQSLGFGDSQLTLMQALGGPRERVVSISMMDQIPTDLHAPILVALQCRGAKGLSLATGRSDTRFDHDGQITKRPIRALTLSSLAPRFGECLWDFGAGSGSISIEWLLSDSSLRAVAFEKSPERCERIQKNAQKFGVAERLTIVCEDFAQKYPPMSEVPDAIFIGGGFSEGLFHHLWHAMPVGTRFVVNAVTLENEALVLSLSQQFGGDILAIQTKTIKPLGQFHVWDSAYPITQWSVEK